MMTRRRFLGGLGVAGASGFGLAPAAGGTEPGSDLRRIRLAQSSAICFAPIFVAGDGLPRGRADQVEPAENHHPGHGLALP